ncbi:MAG: hypothetical protein ACHQ4H_10385 [Ktedonobacterales bacterium]
MVTRPRGARLVVVVLALVGMLALAACSTGGIGGGTTAKATATPDAASILHAAQAIQINDAAFTITLNVSASGSTVSGTGNGKITRSPDRAELDLTLNTAGQQVGFNEIVDGTSKSAYVQIPSLSPKWTKTSSNAAILGSSEITSFSQLQNAKVIGVEQLNGSAVWHLQGTDTVQGETATVDLYVRQENNYPARFKVHGSGTTPLDLTIDFTSINTGVTISLPAAGDIQNSGA